MLSIRSTRRGHHVRRAIAPVRRSNVGFLSFLANPIVLGLIVALVMTIVLWKVILWLFGIIIVPDDSIGTVTKKYVTVGAHRTLPDGQIIALRGEAGFQADTL